MDHCSNLNQKENQVYGNDNKCDKEKGGAFLSGQYKKARAEQNNVKNTENNFKML